MSDNITSHNQAGGVTAKNVTVGVIENIQHQPSLPPPAQKKPWLKIWVISAAVVAFLASVVKILEYFRITPW